METKLMIASEDEKSLNQAVAFLKNGELVAFPTETVYGLGADGLNNKAVEKIYQAKGRPSDNPLILHIAELAQLELLVETISPEAQFLINKYWPGPLTIVFKKTELVPALVSGGLDTVAVRMPDHKIARALIKLANVPLAAPSANTSGRPSPTTAKAVMADLQGKIAGVLDGGDCQIGLESTVVDCSGEIPVLLRPGAITFEMLQHDLTKLVVDQAVVDVKARPKAPGMKYQHYAPAAPLVLFEGENSTAVIQKMLEEYQKALAEGKKVGFIISEETAQVLPKQNLTVVYGSRYILKQIALNLYCSLRFFDQNKVDVIFAEGVKRSGLGVAIMNRLDKACGHNIIKC